MVYEVALIFGLVAIAYFFLEISTQFKIEGDHAGRAFISGALTLICRLMSVATMVYLVFFFRLILQDQLQTTIVGSILTLYDTYISIFLYGFAVIFFTLFFLNQFLTLTENLKIWKYNRKVAKEENKVGY